MTKWSLAIVKFLKHGLTAGVAGLVVAVQSGHADPKALATAFVSGALAGVCLNSKAIAQAGAK